MNDQGRRSYGTVAKDALIGGGVSAAGTAALLAGTGWGLKGKAPALSKMLRTAAGQHIKVFNPWHTGPMMRSLPEASRLFGKQLAGVKEVEHLATGGKIPSVEQVTSAYQKSGINPQRDVEDIAKFKKKWGRTPGESMEKSVGLLSGLAATGVGAAGGAALSKGWERKKEFSAWLDELIEFGIFSAGTARKVFAGLAAGAEKAPLLRPRGLVGSAAYVPKNLSPEEAVAAAEQMGRTWKGIGGKLTPHSVVVPREKGLTPDELAAQKLSHGPESFAAMSKLNDPIAVAAHERGHAYDPDVLPRQAAIKEKAEKLGELTSKQYVPPPEGSTGLGYYKELEGAEKQRAGELGHQIAAGTIQHEVVANQRVMQQVQQHGTPEEIQAWRQSANQQMKVGYRSPMFGAGFNAALRKSGPVLPIQGSGRWMRTARQTYQQMPYINRAATNLASRLGCTSLRSVNNVLNNLIQFDRGKYAVPAMEAIRKAEGMGWAERKLTGRVANPFYEQKAPKEGLPLWQLIRDRAAMKIRTMRKSRLQLSSKLDDLIEFKKKLYQPGIGDEPPEGLPDFTEGMPVDYTVQQHHAKRAGFHRDIRVGTPEHGLYSWATRKELPEAGGKIAIHPQPIHPHSYLGWEGDIPSGYGAGKVSTEHLSRGLVTKSGPDQVSVTVGKSRRLAFIKTRSGHLLVREKHPEPPTAQKPKYKSLAPEKVAESLPDLPAGTVVQPKIDGALVYVKSHKGDLEVFSHRKSKEGHPIIHTERVFKGRPAADLEGKTILGELYGTRKGRAIEPQELGGILNAHVGKSLEKQQQQNVDLKIMPFDIEDKGDYPDRLARLKDLVDRKLPKEKFVLPEEARTLPEMLDMHRTIAKGRHPLTREGIIIHPPSGKMIKVKHTQEANVKITGTFPGGGKFEGAPGGFTYEGGRVGTGFSDETRRQLEEYVGRQARIRHQGQYKSGAYRAPSFIAIEENK